MKVALLSLERWDEVWRRNQHFAAQLVDAGHAESVLFVEPPLPGFALRARRGRPRAGIETITPPLLVPRRFGGYAVLAQWLRRAVRRADVVWVNDPVAGAAVLSGGPPAVYDVTDDWRSMPQSEPDRARIVRAEDRLAVHARTTVCSKVLAERWAERYRVDARLINNGVDTVALQQARPRRLLESPPHLVYVGTAHPNRVDLALVAELAAIGRVHMVGPTYLTDEQRARLIAAEVHLHGPVPAAEVPSWLKAADVLICPHIVDDFTLSLDAIKAYEYLATDRPVVATPSCGFQALDTPGLTVVAAGGFAEAVISAIGTGPFRRAAEGDWRERAAAFAAVLGEAAYA